MKILVTAPLSPESMTKLRLVEGMDALRTDLHPSADELSLAEAMIIRSGTPINAELLAQAPQLKLVVTATSGFDHIDFAACKERGVEVFHTKNANAQSVAELTLGLMIQLARQVSQAQKLVKQHSWRHELPKGFELQGKTLGIVGLGNVGSKVARLAQAFAMNVCAYDPYVGPERFTELNVEAVGLTELFIQSRIVSLHVPLTPETRKLINYQTLPYFSREALLVNTSRGGVIDEVALFEALQDKKISGAALDVFEKEPLPQKSCLRKCTNTIFTTHIGAYTDEAFARTSMSAVDMLLEFFADGPVKPSSNKDHSAFFALSL